MVKNSSANAGIAEGLGSTPGPEDSLEEEMASHSNILAWKIPWTEALPSMGSQRVGHWACKHHQNVKIHQHLGVNLAQDIQTLCKQNYCMWEELEKTINGERYYIYGL